MVSGESRERALQLFDRIFPIVPDNRSRQVLTHDELVIYGVRVSGDLYSGNAGQLIQDLGNLYNMYALTRTESGLIHRGHFAPALIKEAKKYR